MDVNALRYTFLGDCGGHADLCDIPHALRNIIETHLGQLISGHEFVDNTCHELQATIDVFCKCSGEDMSFCRVC